jgi:CBS domain-containing protein
MLAVMVNLEGLTVADVMLRRPKTLAADATAAEVRELLANPSVQVVLLADGTDFRGSVAEIPDDAPGDAPAVGYIEAEPETLPPTESATVAFDVAGRNPYRRVVVLDELGGLVGLVCLDKTRTRFCGK